MSFERIREWISAASLRRMAVLQGIVVGGVLVAVVLVARQTIKHDMLSTTHANMVDDLLDYVRVYQQSGGKVLQRLTGGIRRDRHHGFRITVPQGNGVHEVFESITDELREYEWDRLPPPAIRGGEFDWQLLQHPEHKGELRVLRYALTDGSTFWYGRTDADERAYLAAVVDHLMWIAVIAMIAISVPVAWFGLHVLHPLRVMTTSAQEIAGQPGSGRLRPMKAITEINEFADAFNTSQDRISELMNELHSVNDHLAHELKTPLARVRGNIEDLLDNYGEPEGADAASRSIEEIDRATDLVQNILAIRLGDSGAMKLHLEPTSPFEFISDIVDFYTPSAEERDLEFTFESENDGLVMIDRQRVRQAVTNLLDNAFLYTPAGGSVHVHQVMDGSGFTVKVQDSGPGLTPEDEQRIWKRFARGSAGEKRIKGSGLGLSLVRAVARAHQGEAGCRNRPEGGSEFWIHLPTGPVPELPTHESAAA